MKLVDSVTAAEIVFPYPLEWANEYDWVAVSTSVSFGVGGALIIQKATKLAGREILLKSAATDQGWVPRSVLDTLKTWVDSATKTMVLHLELPSDTRTFSVVFGDNALKAIPVKGWADHESDDYYTIELNLLTT